MSGKEPCALNVLLLDGEPQGWRKITQREWNGVVYLVPRTSIHQYRERKDLQQAGVYVLLGHDDSYEKNVVYVGQAANRTNDNGLMGRIDEHLRNAEKDYWNTAILITDANGRLGATDLSYLEHALTDLAKESGRNEVKNRNTPPAGNPTEEEKAFLDAFVHHVRVALAAVGVNCLEPLEEFEPVPTKLDPADDILVLTRHTRNGEEVCAQGKQTVDGFVVFEGSLCARTIASYVSQSIRNRRAQAEFDAQYRLRKAELFGSPSTAASFVTGGSVNGLNEWKDSQGRSINEREREASA